MTFIAADERFDRTGGCASVKRALLKAVQTTRVCLAPERCSVAWMILEGRAANLSDVALREVGVPSPPRHGETVRFSRCRDRRSICTHSCWPGQCLNLTPLPRKKEDQGRFCV